VAKIFASTYFPRLYPSFASRSIWNSRQVLLCVGVGGGLVADHELE